MQWPVRNVETHVTYKNIFCAICNGVNITKSIEVQSPEAIDYNYISYQKVSISVVEWWPVRLLCPELEIRKYLNNLPTHEKLIELATK